MGLKISYTRSTRDMFIIFFFFFQAEDGIRDIGVTGVQTCALPISLHDLMNLKQEFAKQESLK